MRSLSIIYEYVDVDVFDVQPFVYGGIFLHIKHCYNYYSEALRSTDIKVVGSYNISMFGFFSILCEPNVILRICIIYKFKTM